MSFKKPFKSVPVKVSEDYRLKHEVQSAERVREKRKETRKLVLIGLAIGAAIAILAGF
jgi:hypothetical protein